MATTYTGSTQIVSTAELTTGYGRLQPSVSASQSWAQGTSDDQFDQTYFADQTVAASGTPKDLDLIGGGLVQPDGTAFAPVEINEITIKNLSAAQTLTIGGSPTNPFISWLAASGDGIKIPPMGTFMLIAPKTGFAVTAGSADVLRIATDGGTNVSFTIHLKGRSA